MIIDNVKKQVLEMVNKEMNFIYYGSRNQKDEFRGKVTKIYPAIFLIELEDGQKRTYSYNDLLIGNLKFFE